MAEAINQKEKLAGQDLEGPLGIFGLDHKAAGILIGLGGAVSIGDIDVGLGQALTNPGEFAGMVLNFNHQNVLLQHVKFLPLQKKEGLGGIVGEEPDDGIVHRVVDGNGQEIDPRIGKDRTHAGENAGAILEENGELLANFVQRGPRPAFG